MYPLVVQVALLPPLPCCAAGLYGHVAAKTCVVGMIKAKDAIAKTNMDIFCISTETETP